MFIKLSFHEQLRMFNQFSGAIEVRLDNIEPIDTLQENITPNQRVNKIREQNIKRYDYYLDCKQANQKEVARAIQLFKEYYKSNFLAVSDRDYGNKNELIINLEVALKKADMESWPNFFNSLFKRYPDEKKDFTIKNAEFRDQLIGLDVKKSDYLSADRCTR